MLCLMGFRASAGITHERQMIYHSTAVRDLWGVALFPPSSGLSVPLSATANVGRGALLPRLAGQCTAQDIIKNPLSANKGGKKLDTRCVTCFDDICGHGHCHHEFAKSHAQEVVNFNKGQETQRLLSDRIIAVKIDRPW